MAGRTPGTSSSVSLGDVEVTGIDGKTVANTTVFTNNSGKNFIVTQVFLVTTTVTAYVSAPTVNLGITGANYTDIVNGATGPTANALSVQCSLVSGSSVIPSGTSLVLRVSNGASATTYTLTAVVKGMFI